ncbi:LysR family transcriptional regulator [Pararobbsia alpina]|uniref:LysR family transcriptional regulator n=1 Tax=Pararobbsia alpina TaxID=621374 RepID=UPI0039A529A3
MNQLQAMRVFVKVVELNSFGLAGKQLGMSPAAVSRSIALLEAHLNMRLLNRSTRSFALTEAGHEYLSGCRVIIEKLDEVESSLVMSSRQPTGTLRVATSGLFAVSGLCALLNAYRAEYPEVVFDVHTFESAADFVDGGFEIGFTTERKMRSSTLISRRLMALSRVAVASPAYLERRGRPEAPADLGEHDIVQTPVASAQEWMQWSDPASSRVMPLHAMTTSSSEMARQAALADMGIAVLPSELVEGDLRAGSLERVLPGHTLPDDEREVSLVYSGRRYLSAKTRSFIDFVVAYYRSPAWASSARDSVVEEHGIAA